MSKLILTLVFASACGSAALEVSEVDGAPLPADAQETREVDMGDPCWRSCYPAPTKKVPCTPGETCRLYLCGDGGIEYVCE